MCFQHKEMERERQYDGTTGMNDKFPKSLMNQKANSLLTNKRDKVNGCYLIKMLLII